MQVQRQIDKLLAHRAAEWLETLKSGGSRERRKFAAWLRQSKLHVEHYLEAAAIDREIAALERAQCPDIDELLARAAPHVETLRTPPLSSATIGLGASPARYWKRGAAIAAGFALLALTAFHFKLGFPWQADRVTTVAGEQRSLTLEDGSVIALNTSTDLRIKFSDRERGLMLNTGEAVFKVAHDASRPFIVRTPTAEVRAIGTQFNVYQRGDGTMVSVIEGRVQVTPLASMEQVATIVTAPQSIAAGEEALVVTSGDIQMHPQPDVQKVLAWRQRRLNFDETALEDIVTEFNRYGPAEPLRLEGIPPGTRRYGGVFDADDPESFVALLEREKELKVQRRDGKIVISRR